MIHAAKTDVQSALAGQVRVSVYQTMFEWAQLGPEFYDISAHAPMEPRSWMDRPFYESIDRLTAQFGGIARLSNEQIIELEKRYGLEQTTVGEPAFLQEDFEYRRARIKAYLRDEFAQHLEAHQEAVSTALEDGREAYQGTEEEFLSTQRLRTRVFTANVYATALPVPQRLRPRQMRPIQELATKIAYKLPTK